MHNPLSHMIQWLLLGGVIGVSFGLFLTQLIQASAWLMVVIALLAVLLAWWQAKRIRVSLSSTEAVRDKTPTRVNALKFWLVRLSALFGAMIVGLLLESAYWTTQEEKIPLSYALKKPLWQLGFVPTPIMRDIPAGTFQMGSEKGSDDEKLVHTVTIENAFQMGQYELTFAEYDYYVWLMKKNNIAVDYPNDEGWGRDQHPVINVSWDDAQGYVNWLSKQRAEQSCRLPTEAEWEYATRAGTTTRYWWGFDQPSCNKQDKKGASFDGGEKSNCSYKIGDEYRGTERVGSYTANPWGLYNVHGNVYEWTQDCWNDNYQGSPANGNAWETGGDCGQRVLRGGSWLGSPDRLRSAQRGRLTSDYRSYYVGLRVICALPFTGG